MGGVVKAVSKAVGSVVKIVEKTVKVVGKTIEEVGKFASNVVTGTLKNIIGVIEGALEGDWNKFRDSFLGTFQTALYVLAAIVGGPIGITAAVIALDGQHNDGKLTSYAITAVGKIERELFSSTLILDNVDILSTIVIIGGSLYAGAKGFGFLADVAGISSFLSSYATQINLASGGYAMYNAYSEWQHALALYDELMASYQSWLQQANFEYTQFNKMWDTVYGDLDIWYEASPGGYLFNAAAGSEEYSVSSINEQSAYILALDTKRDTDFDRYFTNPMDIDYVGLNIDDIKPQTLRYKD